MIAITELNGLDKTNVAQRVQLLAKKHHINDTRASIDYVANKFAELSGNDVNEDSIMRLCIKLARHNIVTKPDAMRLIHLYLSGK